MVFYMRKNNLFRTVGAVLSVAIVAGMTGCSSDNLIQSEDVSQETTTVANQEAAEQSETQGAVQSTLAPSEWQTTNEFEYDFKSNSIGFYDSDNGISVGFGGETHYYNKTDNTDWPRSKNESACRHGLDYIDSQLVYACGNGGQLTKSTDGGKTFETKTVSVSSARMISFCDENNGLVACFNRLVITSDGGDNWEDVALPVDIVSIKMITPDNFMCLGKDFNLYTTEDRGASWNTVTLNLPLGDQYLNQPDNAIISKTPDGNLILFCIENDGGALKCFTSNDDFKSYTENTVPDFDLSMVKLNLNHSCNVLTVVDVISKKADVVEVK